MAGQFHRGAIHESRQFTVQLAAGAALWVCAVRARALALTDAEARAGLKAALGRGATAAVSLLGRAAGSGLLSKDDAHIPKYVTDKTLDGLYLMIGEGEKKIRRDPVGTGSDLLKKVFGSI